MGFDLQTRGLPPDKRAAICEGLVRDGESTTTYRIGGMVFDGYARVTTTDSGLLIEYKGTAGDCSFTWDRQNNSVLVEPAALLEDRPHFGDEIISRLLRATPTALVDFENARCASASIFEEFELTPDIAARMVLAVLGEPDELTPASAEQEREAKAMLETLELEVASGAVSIVCPGYELEIDETHKQVIAAATELSLLVMQIGDSLQLHFSFRKRFTPGDEAVVDIAVPGIDRLALAELSGSTIPTVERNRENNFCFKSVPSGKYKLIVPTS